MGRKPRYDPAAVRLARRQGALAKARAARARYKALRQAVADSKTAEARQRLVDLRLLDPSLVGSGELLKPGAKVPAAKSSWPKWLKDRVPKP